MSEKYLALLTTAVAIAVSLAAISAGEAGAETMLKQGFIIDGQKMFYEGDGWTVTAVADLGFTSLKAGDAEFLHSTGKFGGVLYRYNDRWVTYYPNLSNISHDMTLGRRGSVADGLYMVEVRPDFYRPDFTLYAGYNAAEDRQLVVLLNDDVVLLRQHRDGSFIMQQNTIRVDHGRQVPSLTVLHKSGCALIVKSPVTPAMLDDPSGEKRPALIFNTKGFAANEFSFSIDGVRRLGNFVANARIEVDSTPSDYGRSTTNMYIRSGVYHTGEDVTMEIRFDWLAKTPFNGYAQIDITHSLGEPHYHERKTLENATPKEGQTIRARFKPEFHLPGVSEVWARLVSDGGQLIFTDRFRMLYDYEGYKPHTTAQPDMRGFWNQTLAELRETPLEAETVRLPQFEDHPNFEIYLVTYNAWKGQKIYASLFVPKEGKRPFPAIVTSHPASTGYGVDKRADGTYGRDPGRAGFVTIRPIVRGFGPEEPNVPFNHPWWGPLDSRDDYAARYWYCALVRAIDYLATRPDLTDLEPLISTGGSQGGAFALVTAALDDRVDYCFADCPANCQLHEIVQNYPSFGPTKGQIPEGQTLEDMIKTMSYYDPVNMAPWIKAETYIGVNVGDLTVHSMGGLAAYKNLLSLDAGRKGFFPIPGHAHAGSPAYGRKTGEIYERILEERK